METPEIKVGQKWYCVLLQDENEIRMTEIEVTHAGKVIKIFPVQPHIGTNLSYELFRKHFYPTPERAKDVYHSDLRSELVRAIQKTDRLTKEIQAIQESDIKVVTIEDHKARVKETQERLSSFNGKKDVL